MRFTYIKLLVAIYFPPIIALILFLESKTDLLKLSVFSFVVVIYGIAWDMWATKHGRTDKLWIWRFNRKTITGLFIEHHPFDEYLFGILHIFWVVVFWEVLNGVISDFNFKILAVLVLVILWQIWVSRVFYNSQKGEPNAKLVRN